MYIVQYTIDLVCTLSIRCIFVALLFSYKKRQILVNFILLPCVKQ